MACTCPNINCVQSTINSVVYCTCTEVISDITCPIGSVKTQLPNGTYVCRTVETAAPIIKKIPVYYDNEAFFKDVSWTLSYKPTEGTWNSFFTFYPDYSVAQQNFFQTGFNWGESKETMWNHLLNNQSFGVFQGKFNPSEIEFPISNENTNKLLNSITLKVEGRRYSTQHDYSIDKNIGFDELQIWNNTNHSGVLGLNPQKTLTDSRNYPTTNGNKQEILFTSDEDKQNINYFFNRVVNQDNNIPIFNKDENNIFKTVNPNAVKFTGKRTLERLRGNNFMVNLKNTKGSQHNIILENIINDETIIDN